MIAVLDYGAGNVGSVLKAVRRLGFPAERVDCPEFLGRATRVILPGQGHFAAMMGALGERRLVEPLHDWIQNGKPYLGICLGLQALYEASEEAPGVSGLGVLAGTVRRFQGVFKVPHVGWSQLDIALTSKLLAGIAPASFVYYCHSYYGPPTRETTAVTEYGQRFAAVVESGALAAVQFHPEKSADVGLKVLKNFLQL